MPTTRTRPGQRIKPVCREFEGVTFECRVDPATPQALARLEEETCALPQDYREFLLTVNGGRPDRDRFRIGRTHSAMGEFFSLADDVRHGRLRLVTGLETARAVYHDRVPYWGLPIGNDQGGNVLVLSLRPADAGSTYFWDHEKEEQYAAAGGDGPLPKVASSFRELVGGLTETPDIVAEQRAAAAAAPRRRKPAPGARKARG